MEGKIYKLFNVKTGTKKDGTGWKSKEVVLSLSGGTFLYVTAWGDKVEVLEKAHEGQEVEFEFFVKSREYQGKWYTECSLTKIQLTGTYDDVKEDTGLPF